MSNKKNISPTEANMMVGILDRLSNPEGCRDVAVSIFGDDSHAQNIAHEIHEALHGGAHIFGYPATAVFTKACQQEGLALSQFDHPEVMMKLEDTRIRMSATNLKVLAAEFRKGEREVGS